MRDEENYFAFSVTVQDRFGDFGLINVVILRKLPDTIEIDTFLMSCRVLQRGVEQFAMNKIFEFAQSAGCERVVGRYLPTVKNVMVKGFFEQFNFHLVEDRGAEGQTWDLAVSEYKVPREVILSP